jgi:hypothetical protein
MELKPLDSGSGYEIEIEPHEREVSNSALTQWLIHEAGTLSLSDEKRRLAFVAGCLITGNYSGAKGLEAEDITIFADALRLYKTNAEKIVNGLRELSEQYTEVEEVILDLELQERADTAGDLATEMTYCLAKHTTPIPDEMPAWLEDN